jgi:putative acetyltransferase
LVAEADGQLAGLVTVAPDTGYIDQIVVATAARRRGVAAQLIAAARAVSPTVLELHVNQDNAPAVAFYRREGFAVSGEAANPRSGAPTFRMTWRA